MFPGDAIDKNPFQVFDLPGGVGSFFKYSIHIQDRDSKIKCQLS